MAWVWRKDPYKIFELLKPAAFVMQCRGSVDIRTQPIPKKPGWCDLSEVKSAYNVNGKWYYYSSDLFYFSKCEEARKIFDAAKQAFDHPKVKVTQFDGDVPDEFAFSVAAMELDVKQIDQLIFAAWAWKERPDEEALRKSYYAYTIGGSFFSEIIKRRYDKIVKAATTRLGIMPLAVHSKRKWNSKRSKI
jgi:hypothetical protein